MQSSEQEGQELRSDGENQEFTRVCNILCELQKQKYLSIFNENEITVSDFQIYIVSSMHTLR